MTDEQGGLTEAAPCECGHREDAHSLTDGHCYGMEGDCSCPAYQPAEATEGVA